MKSILAFWDRLNALTPRKNKLVGKILTAISGACFVVLTLGDVQNPYAFNALLFIGALTGGGALYNGQKVKR